jgi:hypothetical protein
MRQVLALVLAAGLASCGSPATGPTTTPTPAAPSTSQAPVATLTPTPLPAGALATSLLASAVDTTLAAGTVSMTIDIEFTGSELIPEGTSIGGSGVLAFTERRKATLELDMSALGQGRWAMIIDEPTLWLRFDGTLGKQLGADGRWIRIGEDDTGPIAEAMRGTMSGPNDFSLLLYYLLGAGADARVRDQPVLDGVETTRIEATLDLEAALDRVPAGVHDALLINITDMSRQGVQPTLGSTTWVDGDSLVRRLVFEYALSSVQGGGVMRVSADFSDHGVPLDLGIPPDDEVISIDDLALPSE